jgi:hypothetical protein
MEIILWPSIQAIFVGDIPAARLGRSVKIDAPDSTLPFPEVNSVTSEARTRVLASFQRR